MIISASRRTDIPAFHADWFIERVRAGYCDVPNPFNRHQISRVSLRPEDVDVIVFWTRHPRPLFPYLEELDRLGYRYYFQYSLLDYPRAIEAKTPPAAAAVQTLRELAQRIGPQRVIWRYDPIVLTGQTGADYHRQTYQRLAGLLEGAVTRSVISLVDDYAKARRRMRRMAAAGYALLPPAEIPAALDALIPAMAAAAQAHGMQLVSCAETIDLARYGVPAGQCINAGLIRQVFGIEVGAKKDPSQRKECGCVRSKDIGMYDSCGFGCQYCYATRGG